MSAVVAPIQQSQQTLLIVDDEAAVVASVKRIFRRHNFHILTANRARDALDIMRSQPVSVILADHNMPGMSGAELLKEVRQCFPDVIALMFSGEEDFNTVIDLLNEQVIQRFVAKPWQNDQLVDQVCQAMALSESRTAAATSEVSATNCARRCSSAELPAAIVQGKEYTLVACYVDTSVVHGFDRFSLQTVISRVTGIRSHVAQVDSHIFMVQIGMHHTDLLIQLDSELRRLLNHNAIADEQLTRVYQLCGLCCPADQPVSRELVDAMAYQLPLARGGCPVWLPTLLSKPAQGADTGLECFGGLGVIPQADLSSGLICSLQLLYKWPASVGFISLNQLAHEYQAQNEKAMAGMLSEAERLLRFSPDLNRLVLPIAKVQLESFGFAFNLRTLCLTYQIDPARLVLECDVFSALRLTVQGLHNLAILSDFGIRLQIALSQPDITTARQLQVRGVTQFCLAGEQLISECGQKRHIQTEQFMAWCVEHDISLTVYNLNDIAQAHLLGQAGVSYGAGECIGRVAGRDKIRQQLVMQPLQRGWQTH